jgi:hypothetical protein
MLPLHQRIQASLSVSLGFLVFWSFVLSSGFGGLTLAAPFILGGLAPIALLIALRVCAKAGAVAQGTYTVQRAALEGALFGAAVSVAGTVGLFIRSAQAAGPVPRDLLIYQLLPTAALLGGALGAGHGVLAFYATRKLATSRGPRPGQ